MLPQIQIININYFSEEACNIYNRRRTLWSKQDEHSASVELIRRVRRKDSQRRASLKRTIHESFGVSIGVLVQVDSCDSETHCLGCGGSEFLILNKIDLARLQPSGSKILTVATRNSGDDSIFGPNWKTADCGR